MVIGTASLLPAYMVGSIPYGYLFGRFKGIDIRQHGSGNIGATNVWRVMGKWWGMLAFVLDFLKVFVAAWLSSFVHQLAVIGPSEAHVEVMTQLFIFLGSVLGHNFPIWLKFRGGKGIATSAGGLLWLMPQAFLVTILTWVVTFGLFRYVSLASIISASTVPMSVWILYPHAKRSVLFVFSCVLAVMAIWKHRANIQRLVQGTEHQWSKNPKEKKAVK